MISPERSLSYQCLLEVFYDKKYSKELIDFGCNELKDKSKKAFFTRLFLGTIEEALFLDEAIKRLSKRRIKDIQRSVLVLLRQSLYELFFMNTPEHATVDITVKLCEERKLFKAKGFINAVLRRACEEKEQIQKEIYSDGDEKKRLSYDTSLPLWLVDYLSEVLTSKEIKSSFNNKNKAHSLFLRINKNKIETKEYENILLNKGISAKIIEENNCIMVENPVTIRDLPGFNEGLFYVQDPGGIQAVSALEIGKEDIVVDLCAAPGGKGLLAASFAKNGLVSMRDKSEEKIALIDENARRMGIDNINIKVFSALDIDEDYMGRADVVIADLPCSGLGTLSGKPEIKYRLSMEDIEALSKMQRQMLDIAPLYLKSGGKLMYSTCTIGKKENDDNADYFLEKNPEFKEITRKQILPDFEGRDGFYYALFKKD